MDYRHSPATKNICWSLLRCRRKLVYIILLNARKANWNTTKNGNLFQVVQFHPNSNYVATGSSDMTVRLWDCVTGSQVRLMTGHKAPIYSLAFSAEGRFLASAGADHRVLVWDLAHGHLVAALSNHSGTVHCLSFSRDGNILVSGWHNRYLNFYKNKIYTNKKEISCY